jgi:hypothetical protein
MKRTTLTCAGTRRDSRRVCGSGRRVHYTCTYSHAGGCISGSGIDVTSRNGVPCRNCCSYRFCCQYNSKNVGEDRSYCHAEQSRDKDASDNRQRVSVVPLFLLPVVLCLKTCHKLSR